MMHEDIRDSQKSHERIPRKFAGLGGGDGYGTCGISRFKNGECGMSLATLDKIAPTLGLSMTAKPGKGKRTR